MKTKHFCVNHFGLYSLYNAAHKVYAHTLLGKKHERRVDPNTGKDYTVELPVANAHASRLCGSFKSPMSAIEAQARYRPSREVARLKTGLVQTSKPLSPVETAE